MLGAVGTRCALPQSVGLGLQGLNAVTLRVGRRLGHSGSRGDRRRIRCRIARRPLAYAPELLLQAGCLVAQPSVLALRCPGAISRSRLGFAHGRLGPVCPAPLTIALGRLTRVRTLGHIECCVRIAQLAAQPVLGRACLFQFSAHGAAVGAAVGKLRRHPLGFGTDALLRIGTGLLQCRDGLRPCLELHRLRAALVQPGLCLGCSCTALGRCCLGTLGALLRTGASRLQLSLAVGCRFDGATHIPQGELRSTPRLLVRLAFAQCGTQPSVQLEPLLLERSAAGVGPG